MSTSSGKNPLYIELYLNLKNKIENGEYKVGMKLPSEKELAEEHGVSRITSKHALDQLAREGLISRFPGKGSYIQSNSETESFEEPTGAEETPAAISTKLIGVVMEGMQADFGGEILIGIEKECAKAGYSAIIKFSYGNEERERACIDELLDAGVEGILLMCVYSEVYNSTIMKLSLDGFPLVFIDRSLNGLPIPYVGTNHFEAAKALTDELINRGNTNLAIAMTEDSHTTSSAEARIHGYVQECLDNELLCANRRILLQREDVLRPDMEIRQENIRRVRGFLDAHRSTTAILCLSATIASIVIQALDGYDGGEYLLAAFDGPRNVLNMPHDFIYVLQDQQQMGMTACAQLIDRINEKEVQMITDVPYTIISCAPGQSAMLHQVI